METTTATTTRDKLIHVIPDDDDDDDDNGTVSSFVEDKHISSSTSTAITIEKSITRQNSFGNRAA